MNNEELMVSEALNYFGFGIREVSQRELKYTFLSFDNELNPNTCTNEMYKDGIEYNKMLKYYDLIKDVRKTNEIVHNILSPNHKEHFYTEGEKTEEVINPEIVDEIPHQERMNQNPFGDVKIVDKPSVFSILISLLLPIYGLISSILVRPLMPKASRWYLVFAILGFVLNFILIILVNFI